MFPQFEGKNEIPNRFPDLRGPQLLRDVTFS